MEQSGAGRLPVWGSQGQSDFLCGAVGGWNFLAGVLSDCSRREGAGSPDGCRRQEQPVLARQGAGAWIYRWITSSGVTGRESIEL